jgi:hypothetical protein
MARIWRRPCFKLTATDGDESIIEAWAFGTTGWHEATTSESRRLGPRYANVPKIHTSRHRAATISNLFGWNPPQISGGARVGDHANDDNLLQKGCPLIMRFQQFPPTCLPLSTASGCMPI